MDSGKRPGRRGSRPDDFVGDFADEKQFAHGTGVEPNRLARPSFRVTIHYREPEFEARRGRTGEPYRWTYRIAAADRAAAESDALRQFEATAAASSVSWRRDVVAIDAVLDEPPPEPGQV